MKRLFSTILFLFLATLLFSTLTIHYLDVGQKETLYFIQTSMQGSGTTALLYLDI
jgi:hypothetical protein